MRALVLVLLTGVVAVSCGGSPAWSVDAASRWKLQPASASVRTTDNWDLGGGAPDPLVRVWTPVSPVMSTGMREPACSSASRNRRSVAGSAVTKLSNASGRSSVVCAASSPRSCSASSSRARSSARSSVCTSFSGVVGLSR